MQLGLNLMQGATVDEASQHLYKEVNECATSKSFVEINILF